MDRFLIAATSGLRARLESLEMLANNIANANTAGFKADREFYNLYLAPEALEPGGEAPTLLPVVESQWTDFTQGTLSQTGNSTDLALSGEGFFVVEGPDGALYTRNGNFRVREDGTLETQQGYAVRAAGGGALRIDPSKDIEVTAEGAVRQQGQTVGQIEIAGAARPGLLSKRGGNYFQLVDPSLAPARAQGVRVYQGRVESANFSPAEGAVRLVSVMRQFEMLQKAISLGAEMNRRVLDEVAKPGS